MVEREQRRETIYVMNILEIVTSSTSLAVKSLEPSSAYEKHPAPQLNPETRLHILRKKERK